MFKCLFSSAPDPEAFQQLTRNRRSRQDLRNWPRTTFCRFRRSWPTPSGGNTPTSEFLSLKDATLGKGSFMNDVMGIVFMWHKCMRLRERECDRVGQKKSKFPRRHLWTIPKGSFINDVMQIWPSFFGSSSTVTLLCLICYYHKIIRQGRMTETGQPNK